MKYKWWIFIFFLFKIIKCKIWYKEKRLEEERVAKEEEERKEKERIAEEKKAIEDLEQAVKETEEKEQIEETSNENIEEIPKNRKRRRSLSSLYSGQENKESFVC